MKIFNWIDTLFDTRQKRILWLIVLVSIYWIWTAIWEILFFSRLTTISDYASLFDFLNIMDRYDKTVLIRIVFSVVSSSGLTFKGIMRSLSFYDVLFLFGTALVMLQTEAKIHKIWLGITETVFLIGLMILLIMGFQSGTLSAVIDILRYIGLFGICMKMVQAGMILIDLIKNIHDYIF